ncbi:ArsR/SmtB family transcription factor [Prosthecodimorpha staleyi]|uniref:Metalloregulator ArsR/SmtB family transcription factor n=1 Tax=Prosthecodimorpha staleyi TaxID=2840188 RepID=A0A947D8N3_9HYPH|nr:metalloregulator ArsR/SmtB family transcription factor [Prosthecodimorpha staleyi]MBT9292418.1 metalloregulator ArsR/SmtB family transcription factor [Prosthecodimorpha staleyi]
MPEPTIAIPDPADDSAMPPPVPDIEIAALGPAEIRSAAEVFKGLGHDGRLAALAFLADGEKSVGDICDHLHLNQPATSQILAALRASRLVAFRREGKNVLYQLAAPELADLIRIAGRLKF